MLSLKLPKLRGRRLNEGDLVLKQGGKLVKPERLPNGLFRFKDNTGFDRVVLDCVTSLKHGADLLWIETEKPHVGQIAEMVNAIREQVPNAKLVITTLHHSTGRLTSVSKYLMPGVKKVKTFLATTARNLCLPTMMTAS